MTVFKYYFKIVNKHKISLGLYFIIFVVITASFGLNAKNQNREFESYKPPVYFKNESSSLIADKLEAVLKDHTVFSEKTTDESADDELFYQMIAAIITIPENFEDTEKVEIKLTPGSKNAFLVSQLIENFMTKVKAYEKSGFDKLKALNMAEADMKKEVNIEYHKGTEQPNFAAQSFFNMLNYTIMAQVILVVTMLMASFKKKEIDNRNRTSPISNARFSYELNLGHLTISSFLWLSYIAVFVIIWPESVALRSSHMMFLNSFIFTMVIVSLALLLTNILRSENAIQGVMNVLALGSSFISGAFVPQEFLSSVVLNISKFFPSYYYVRNNNLIAGDIGNAEILYNSLIMLAFMLGFLSVSIMLKSRKKAK